MPSSRTRRRGCALALAACALTGGEPEAVQAKVATSAGAWDSAWVTGTRLPIAAEKSLANAQISAGSIRLAASQSSSAAAISSDTPAGSATTGRFLIQVLVPKALLYAEQNLEALVVGQVEQGALLEADTKLGEWYRVKRVGTDPAWIFNAVVETGMSLAVLPFPAKSRIDVGAANRDPRATLGLSAEELAARAGPRDQGDVERRRPQGEPLEPRLPLIDPSQVSSPTPFDPRGEVPLRDRWRILKALKLLPYDLRDPYNPNVLKGDLPVLEEQLGPEWFFNLAAISDTVLEARRLPTAVGIQSTRNPGSNSTFGRGNQSTLVQTVILSLSLIKGDTVFRPPDYEFRFVPVVNVNRTMTEEVRAVNVDPTFGIDRDDSFIGVQELFVDKHLRDVSTRYDFDSVRLGIQPFTADFRGFLFIDQPFGLRFFGTRDNNRWQYNAAWLRRIEKDTNSGLNDLGKRLRADDVYVANL